jgi:hypothetical protein
MLRCQQHLQRWDNTHAQRSDACPAFAKATGSKRSYAIKASVRPLFSSNMLHLLLCTSSHAGRYSESLRTSMDTVHMDGCGRATVRSHAHVSIVAV